MYNEEIKVSVIVPIFKAEKFLDRCIKSIIHQTFNDWELLLIDDGSPDRSGTICEEWAKKEKRIKVFHKENGGASSARNVGLENVQGKYVLMLDSDDWIDRECLRICVETADENDLDFVDYGFRYVDGNGNVVDNMKRVGSPVLSLSEFVAYKYSTIKGTAGTFYKNKAIGNIRYDTKLIANEDHMFFIHVMSKIKRAKIIPNVFYNIYGEDEESVTHQSGYWLKQFKTWAMFNSIMNDFPIQKRWFDIHSIIVLRATITYTTVPYKEIRHLFEEAHIDSSNLDGWKDKIMIRIANFNYTLFIIYSLIISIIHVIKAQISSPMQNYKSVELQRLKNFSFIRLFSK